MSDMDKIHREEEFRPVSHPVRYNDPISENITKQDESIRAMKSIGEFVAFGGKNTVKVSVMGNAPQLGKSFEMLSPIPMSSVPVKPPSCNLRDAKRVQIAIGSEDSLSARQKLDKINERINQPKVSKSEQKPVQTGPSPEELKLGISVERLVFLERVEKIMASEARIKEIEAENKTLVSMVTRLQKEIDDMKAKAAQKL